MVVITELRADTIAGTLDAIAERAPDTSVTFATESQVMTITDLVDASHAVGAGLRAAGVEHGDVVGLLCPNTSEFFHVLFGGTRLGCAIAPLPVPVSMRNIDGYVARLQRIVSTASMKHLVMSEQFAGFADVLRPRLPGVQLLDAAALRRAGGRTYESVSASDLAIVQFTSGSTSAPKGVQLSHANVLSGVESITRGIEVNPQDSGGFWLPLFHDMGLFASLTALLNGRPSTIWSPVDFIKNPGRWLRRFSETGATISAGPNFGYDYLVAAVAADEAYGIDLSRWRIAFNGAESIADDSIATFLDRFAPSGFRPTSMFPVYGMAEATLAVTFPPLLRAPVFDYVDRAALSDGLVVPARAGAAGTKAVANVGRAVPGMSVRVSDTVDGSELQADRVGQIEIRGDAVTAGYLNHANTETFAADGWLRTGDLGYLRGTDLHVTGRLKEMITVRGANFYPEDVESAVRPVSGVFKRRCVAFAHLDPAGREQIALVVETDLDEPTERASLARTLRDTIKSDLDLDDVAIHLVEPRTIPRTSSGKLQRLATRTLVCD